MSLGSIIMRPEPRVLWIQKCVYSFQIIWRTLWKFSAKYAVAAVLTQDSQKLELSTIFQIALFSNIGPLCCFRRLTIPLSSTSFGTFFRFRFSWTAGMAGLNFFYLFLFRLITSDVYLFFSVQNQYSLWKMLRDKLINGILWTEYHQTIFQQCQIMWHEPRSAG